MPEQAKINIEKAISQMRTALEAKHIEKFGCGNCGAEGYTIELFWDKDGDPRCPECCSCEIEYNQSKDTGGG